MNLQRLFNNQLKTCSICLEYMRWKTKKLMCGHKFHLECLKKIYKSQCPLCEHPIFNRREKKLLKCTNSSKIKSLLQNYFIDSFENIYLFIKTQDPHSNYLQIMKFAYRYCDFTDILASNLNNLSIVTELLENCHQINWHKTFNGGKTFFELVLEKTTNLLIINLILDKLPTISSLENTQNSSEEQTLPSAPFYPMIAAFD